ncbi:monosaccharide ABC transporter membrane protein, CUT2 family [Agrobacterium fabrum]|uniref:Autoinducer 2 import system permease protein LsrD n=1 Tax=Agrobacterium fabrum TaxID=1176649 RepID=A0A7Z7BRW6_9HYPH|nr:ABC transporter permease [Agrobacterium fabrum]SDK34489.1 monosaccharide ABC transporter membrane protein, CUT2 family [Agrobacterium fabrum]
MVQVSDPIALSGKRSIDVRAVARAYGIHLALLALILISAVLSPAFLSAGNVSNMLLQLAPLGVVVIGQTLVILVRGLDLSVASVMATAAVVATSFTGRNTDAFAIVLVAVGIGLLAGLVNGLLITKRNVSPFLATLATMIVLQGMRFAVTQGAPSGNVPPFFRTVGSQLFYGIPYNLMILAVTAAVFTVLLRRTTFGRKVYITGGNPVTARLVGINADRITIACYLISGALAAIAGLILSGFVGIVDNWVGRGFELDSIVAAVIGGVALSGGRGTILGALVGATILVVVFNAALLLGLPIEFQILIKGVVIVTAAAFYVRRSEK